MSNLCLPQCGISLRIKMPGIWGVCHELIQPTTTSIVDDILIYRSSVGLILLVKLESYQFSSAGVYVYLSKICSLFWLDQQSWMGSRLFELSPECRTSGEFTVNRLYRWLTDLNQPIMRNSIIVGLRPCLLLAWWFSFQMSKLESVWFWRSVVFAWRHSCLGSLRSDRGTVELFTLLYSHGLCINRWGRIWGS